MLRNETFRTSVTVPAAVPAVEVFICTSSVQSVTGLRPESLFTAGYLTDAGPSVDNDTSGTFATRTSKKGDSTAAQHLADVGTSHGATKRLKRLPCKHGGRLQAAVGSHRASKCTERQGRRQDKGAVIAWRRCNDHPNPKPSRTRTPRRRALRNWKQHRQCQRFDGRRVQVRRQRRRRNTPAATCFVWWCLGRRKKLECHSDLCSCGEICAGHHRGRPPENTFPRNVLWRVG